MPRSADTQGVSLRRDAIFDCLFCVHLLSRVCLCDAVCIAKSQTSETSRLKLLLDDRGGASATPACIRISVHPHTLMAQDIRRRKEEVQNDSTATT